LLNQTYQHGGYREFIVSDSKKRKIKAAPFRDRVVHHALCNIIEPIFASGSTSRRLGETKDSFLTVMLAERRKEPINPLKD